ncbi:MAG: (deoxy)nucleoside triphosphate pyrophosphohydrolase [Candidatus Muirbacterium halophilum]|nr:(deoxy)nucleoside triphosphate pyrophosphohydrolase [Candidatus Muirbacterium halophilum]MCK9476485.1 (deoxy)nucleoside triphosphate pyrophosphohydrolase [Candidatus Muirbacterium halophilum]
MKNVKTVAAAIMEKNGKFLIAKRKNGQSHEGKWEFPGGKLIPGETLEKCLERELEEEFSILTKTHNFFDKSFYEYESGVIELVAYYSEHIDGEFIPIVHSDIKWVSPEELLNHDLSPADISIAKNLIKLHCGNCQEA